jgi:CheY-specific phosphatase CheX
MSVKFFGQFLVDRGHLTSKQLVEALNDKDALPLATLAVTRGLMSAERARELLGARRGMSDFGALAVKRGWLTDEQLRYLEFLQKSDAGQLCNVLLKRHILEQELLEFEVAEFNKEQRQFSLRAQRLPEGHAGRADMISIVSMTENMLTRYAIQPFHINGPELYSGRVAVRDITVRLGLSGDFSGACVMSMDRALVSIVAGQLFGQDGFGADEMLRDALGEFCNLVLGSAAAALSSLGHSLAFGTPELVAADAPPTLVTNAAAWQIETPWGRLALLVE